MAVDRGVSAGLVFLAACIAELPIVYHLVRADEEARLAPLVIVFAASSMLTASAAGLAIERKRPGLAVVVSGVVVAEAPALWWLAGNVERYALVPDAAVAWAVVAAVAVVVGLALLLTAPGLPRADAQAGAP